MSAAGHQAPVTPAKKASEKDKLSKRGNSYRHITKDPVIDALRTEAQRYGGQKLPKEYLERLAYESGISVSTLHNWFFGDTQRPQNLTVRFVLAALGVRIQYMRADGTQMRVGH